jgi:hypothetical protein
MSFASNTDRSNTARRSGELSLTGGWVLATALLVLGSAACVPPEATEQAPQERLADLHVTPPSEGTVTQSGIISNGIISNGIISNGIISNGIISNGIISNGLSNTAMSTSDFASWFNSSASTHATLMSYLVRCAVPAGQTRTWTNPSTGQSYSWAGGLGLAAGWASGNAATVLEQQVVTACLLAHVNKFGLHVDLSLLGRDAQGTALPIAAGELSTYSEPEGCFFGNGFNSSATFYAGSDHATLSASQSSVRACAMDWAGGAADCAPIVHVGACSQYCTKDATGTYYTSCTYNGTTYRPLTTRIRPADVYTCGDGVCQVSEKCGTGTTYDSCAADCGACS